MAKITTLAGMKNYIRSVCGEPVITVELADAQLERIIEDTVQYFQKYHSGEGNYKDFLAFTITQGTSAYSTSGLNLAEVVDLDLSFGSDGINTLFSPTHSLLWRDWVLYGNYPGGNGYMGSQTTGMMLAGYEIASQYLEDIKDTFGSIYHGQFSEEREEVLIYPTPTEGGTALMTVYKKNTAENLYNNDMVKRLAVAEAKIQWGNNLNKYNMTLPHGGTINGEAILQQGKEEKEKIIEDIYLERENTCFFID